MKSCQPEIQRFISQRPYYRFSLEICVQMIQATGVSYGYETTKRGKILQMWECLNHPYNSECVTSISIFLGNFLTWNKTFTKYFNGKFTDICQ